MGQAQRVCCPRREFLSVDNSLDTAVVDLVMLPTMIDKENINQFLKKPIS